MKPSIDKETEAYLASLDEKNPDEPDYYFRDMDEYDKLIYEGGLRVQRVIFEKELDLMVILLNSKKIITRSISEFPRLEVGNDEQLNAYEISPSGIHWDELDEDLSLKGFLRHEVNKVLRPEVA
ncbi:MAG: DUF2442 domain-containing protein [Bacteroidota bacterium]